MWDTGTTKLIVSRGDNCDCAMAASERRSILMKNSLSAFGLLLFLIFPANSYAENPQNTLADIEFWQSVKDSGDSAMLEAYLEEFPDGKFKSLAKIKIKQLTGGKEEVTSASSTRSVAENNQQTQSQKQKNKYFDICEKAFNNTNFRLEHKLYKDWADVVYHGVIKAWPQQSDAADLVEKCKPFLSDDLLTWTASSQTQTDTSGQAASNASQSSVEDSLPKTSWCGGPSRSYEATAAECIGANGIPMRTKDDAQWVTKNYFGEFEEHKAFAISNGSFGLAAYRHNPTDAKRLALLSCNMRAIDARTCRVVNTNGVGANLVDFQESSKPVFSAQGRQQDLAGRYHLRLRDSDGMNATLKLKVTSGGLDGSVVICFEATHCATYQIKELFEQRRGRYFRSALKLGHNPGARWPEGWQLTASFSSDTTLVIGEVGPYVFDGEKYSQ